jgi:hypothetical protein
MPLTGILQRGRAQSLALLIAAAAALDATAQDASNGRGELPSATGRTAWPCGV